MLANRKTVRGIVEALAGEKIKSDSIYRRYWCDKTQISAEQRLLTFRFWSKTEADTVAQRLQAALTEQGYTNKVRRTSVESDYFTYTTGGEYVRLRVMFE